MRVEHEEGATVETNERKRNFRLSRASPEKPLKKNRGETVQGLRTDYVRDDNDKGCHDRARLIVSINVLSRRNSSFLEVKLRYFDSQATDTIAELETQVNQLKQALQDSEFQRQRQLRVRNVHTFPLCVFVCFYCFFH